MSASPHIDHARVKVYPQVAIAPAVIRITATIPEHPANRAFCVGAYLNGNTVRRSCEQLEGADAAVTHLIEWKEPLREGGEYVIGLDVYRSASTPADHADTPLKLKGIEDDGGV